MTENADGTSTYSLKIKKQPGTSAIPISIRIRLPAGSTLEVQHAGWTFDGQDILIETNLRVDLHIEVIFRAPENPK